MASGSLTIVRLRPGDGPALAALHAMFRPHEHARDMGFYEDMLAQRTSFYLVALHGKTPLGWLVGYKLRRFRSDEMFLYELDVSPNARRQGVASALIRAIADAARSEGCAEVFVLTETTNAAGKHTYESAGFSRASPDSALYTIVLRR